jgi:hypothetical protein
MAIVSQKFLLFIFIHGVYYIKISTHKVSNADVEKCMYITWMVTLKALPTKSE